MKLSPPSRHPVWSLAIWGFVVCVATRLPGQSFRYSRPSQSSQRPSPTDRTYSAPHGPAPQHFSTPQRPRYSQGPQGAPALIERRSPSPQQAASLGTQGLGARGTQASVQRSLPQASAQVSAALGGSPEGGQTSRLGAIQRNQPPGLRTGHGEHLAEWMNQHSSLSPTQQQQALEREPGFHDLPQPTQERMRQRLSQLNTMAPAQRQRLLARNEAIEHLAPDQRSELRGAMQQLGALPPDQRRSVAHSFRELRDLPVDQRMAALNSDRYRGTLNETQRSALTNLLRVEPIVPH